VLRGGGEVEGRGAEEGSASVRVRGERMNE